MTDEQDATRAFAGFGCKGANELADGCHVIGLPRKTGRRGIENHHGGPDAVNRPPQVSPAAKRLRPRVVLGAGAEERHPAEVGDVDALKGGHTSG